MTLFSCRSQYQPKGNLACGIVRNLDDKEIHSRSAAGNKLLRLCPGVRGDKEDCPAKRENADRMSNSQGKLSGAVSRYKKAVKDQIIGNGAA